MIYHKRYGRKEPYTQIGIKRLVCYRCGAGEPRFQWNSCADGGLYPPICADCDILLNLVALKFMRDPDINAKMLKYIVYVRSGMKK